eukprot:m.168983 g.168983  ORF g.168983 m.168983 type:complete len:299 (+) comp10361_c0_seq4:71-967(+)
MRTRRCRCRSWARPLEQQPLASSTATRRRAGATLWLCVCCVCRVVLSASEGRMRAVRVQGDNLSPPEEGWGSRTYVLVTNEGGDPRASVKRSRDDDDEDDLKRKRMTCYKCGGEGHIADMCPSAANARDLPDAPECHTCHGRGHVKARCPNSIPRGMCYKCGAYGHNGRECGSAWGMQGGYGGAPGGGGGYGGHHGYGGAPGGGYGGPGGYGGGAPGGGYGGGPPGGGYGGGFGGPRLCYRCQQPGHQAANCPRLAEQGATANSCYKCGLEGHIAKDCQTCYVCKQTGHISTNCPNRV